MLYPVTTFTVPNDNNLYAIPSGTLFVFPFTILEGDAKDIIVVHTAGTSNQDHSLRAWVSETAGGQAIDGIPAYLQMWHPNRTSSEIFTVYDEGIDQPDRPYPIPLAPGDYVVNVLNLVNRANLFSYQLTDL